MSTEDTGMHKATIAVQAELALNALDVLSKALEELDKLLYKSVYHAEVGHDSDAARYAYASSNDIFEPLSDLAVALDDLKKDVA